MDINSSKIYVRSILVSLLLLSINSFAAEIDYGLALGVTTYENVNLVNEPVADERSRSVRGVFTYDEDTSEHVTVANIDIEAINYKEDQLDDEVNGAITAESTIIINPQLFEWYVTDVFSRITIDPLEASSSTNLINTNAFLTGPNFYFRLNKNNNLNFTVRAESYIFEEAELENADNNRLTTTASAVHSINSNSGFSLNFEYSIVDYDNENLNSNFDRVDGFLGFDYERGLYEFTAEAGVTNVFFEDESLEDANQPRYLVSFRAQRTRNTNIRFEAFQTVTDTSTSILDQLNTDNTLQATSTSNSDLYQDTGGRISYASLSPSSNFTFDVGYIETRYNTLKELDVDTARGAIQYQTSINTTSGITFDAIFAQSTYTELPTERVDDDVLYSISYRVRLRRTINVRLAVEDEERVSTDEIQSYEDFRIRLILEYVSI